MCFIKGKVTISSYITKSYLLVPRQSNSNTKAISKNCPLFDCTLKIKRDDHFFLLTNGPSQSTQEQQIANNERTSSCQTRNPSWRLPPKRNSLCRKMAAVYSLINACQRGYECIFGFHFQNVHQYF